MGGPSIETVLASGLGDPGLVPLRVLLFRTGHAAARRQPAILFGGPSIETVLAAGLGDPSLVPFRVLLFRT